MLSFFKNQNKLAVSNVDTRALVKYIRENGAMNALITTELDKIDSLKRELKNSINERNGASLKGFNKNTLLFGNPNSKFKVAAIDLGIKKIF